MAGRIPQNFVDELLDRVDIVELIDGRVKLKKSGKNYMACCPFHDEKTPSFSVNAEKQFYHCFGCGASGNAIGFLMEYEHRGFPDVVEQLAKQCGMEVPREEGFDSAQQKQRQDIYSMLEKTAKYYQEQLRSHPQAGIAQDYLKGRGLTGLIAHQFGIGYAPPGWDNLLRYAGTDDTGRALLARAGLLVEKSQDETANTKEKTYDRFRHRIMFPIRDVRGRVIGFGGRVLNDDKPKYLNSPETDVFHKGRELYGLYEALQANRHLDRILVVEGYMDVVALAQFGITFATATLGTAASEDHLDKAFRHAPEVVFCFDGDEAGRRAARRALEVSLPTLSEGRQVRFLFLPDDEDPDTLVRKMGKDDFLRRLQDALPLSGFLFDVASEGLNLSTPEGRARLVTNVLPFLQRIPEGPYKQQLKNLLASRSQSDVNEISALLAAAPAGPAGKAREASQDRHVTRRPGNPLHKPVPSVTKTGLADVAVGLLLQQPALLGFCTEEVLAAAGIADSDRLARLVSLLHELPEASLNKLIGRWHALYGEEESNYLYQLAGKESLLGREEQAQELRDTLLRLGQVPQERGIEQLIEQSRRRALTPEEQQELNRLLKATRGSPKPSVTGGGGA